MSLEEDLPTGLEPTPLGTGKSVVSSMPPNEMHRATDEPSARLCQVEGDVRTTPGAGHVLSMSAPRTKSKALVPSL